MLINFSEPTTTLLVVGFGAVLLQTFARQFLSRWEHKIGTSFLPGLSAVGVSCLSGDWKNFFVLVLVSYGAVHLVDRLLFARVVPSVHTGDGPPPFAVVIYGMVVAGLEYRNYRALRALERTQELSENYRQLVTLTIERTDAVTAQAQAAAKQAQSSLEVALQLVKSHKDPVDVSGEIQLYSPYEFEFFESFTNGQFSAAALVFGTIFAFKFFRKKRVITFLKRLNLVDRFGTQRGCPLIVPQEDRFLPKGDACESGLLISMLRGLCHFVEKVLMVVGATAARTGAKAGQKMTQKEMVEAGMKAVGTIGTLYLGYKYTISTQPVMGETVTYYENGQLKSVEKKPYWPETLSSSIAKLWKKK